MRKVVIFVLFCFYLISTIHPIIVSELVRTTLVGCFCYPLLHANIFHLLCNSIAIWFTFDTRLKYNSRTLLVSYVISAVSFVTFGGNMVGFSNIVYAAIGIRTPSIKSKWWRQYQTIIFLTVMIAFMFVGVVAGKAHVFSFLAGVAISNISRFVKSNLNDYERVRHI